MRQRDHLGFIVIVVFFIFLATGHPLTFERNYGGRANETGIGVMSSDDGGFLVAGYAESIPGFGATVLVKTDSNGYLQWQRFIEDSAGMVILNTAIKTAENGFVLAGQKQTVNGDWNIYVEEIDAGGGTVWQRTFGSPADDRAMAICRTSDGGWLVMGNTLESGGYDIFLVRLDEQGEEVWSRIIGSSETDLGYAVTETRDGGFVIAGVTYSPGVRFSDVLIGKVAYWGEVVWWRWFGDSLWDEARTIVTDTGAGFVIAGFSSSENGDMDATVWRVDSNGNRNWFQRLNRLGHDRVYGLLKVADGFLLIGESYQENGEADLCLFRITGDGQLLWQRFYGGEGYDCGFLGLVLVDGGFVITGRTWVNDNNRFDIYLLRTDSLGVIGMKERCRGVGCRRYWGVFPNPFRTRVMIESERSRQEIKVLDQAGVLVNCLQINGGRAGWDGRNFRGEVVPAGVYIFMSSEGQRIKVVKNK